MSNTKQSQPQASASNDPDRSPTNVLIVPARYMLPRYTDPKARPTPEEINIEGKVITDYQGNPIDGGWVKDPMVYRWAAIVTFILLCSWVCQWVIYVLPYWRVDVYHQAGLFKVCGNRQFSFDPDALNGAGEIYPNITIDYTCWPLTQYINDFIALVEAPVDKNDPQTFDYWSARAKETTWHVLASRYFEGISTVFSMIFGITTIYMVLRPSPDERKNTINGVFALIGIILTPWFCAIDIFLSINAWNWVGVGIYTSNALESMGACGQLSIVTAAVDFVVQLWFLRWGFKMYRKRIPGQPVSQAKWWETE